MEEIPLVRDLVSEQRYRLELIAHPPALVVLWSGMYPRRQEAVFMQFVQEHGYIHSAVANVSVAVRPDRFEQFLQDGTAK
jgi:hypothetical protein